MTAIRRNRRNWSNPVCGRHGTRGWLAILGPQGSLDGGELADVRLVRLAKDCLRWDHTAVGWGAGAGRQPAMGRAVGRLQG